MPSHAHTCTWTYKPLACPHLPKHVFRAWNVQQRDHACLMPELMLPCVICISQCAVPGLQVWTKVLRIHERALQARVPDMLAVLQPGGGLRVRRQCRHSAVEGLHAEDKPVLHECEAKRLGLTLN